MVPSEKDGVLMSSIDLTRNFIPLSIAILTMSDTRSMALDRSGSLLSERITNSGHQLADRKIVIDDLDKIRQTISAWIDDRTVDVIITTGGTGFTGRDVTPEAIEPLFEKRMNGFFPTYFIKFRLKKLEHQLSSHGLPPELQEKLLFFVCLDHREPAKMVGMESFAISWTIVSAHAILLK